MTGNKALKDPSSTNPLTHGEIEQGVMQHSNNRHARVRLAGIHFRKPLDSR